LFSKRTLWIKVDKFSFKAENIALSSFKAI
jgi:hypothetical protein